MALSPTDIAARDRSAASTPAAFDLNNGYETLFPQGLNDIAVLSNASAREASAAADSSVKTADDRVQTGQDRAAAARSAEQAATFEPANFVRRDGTQAMTGPLAMFAGTTQRGGANLPQRGSAPSAPANGDLWSLATGLWGYFGGVARQFYDTTSLPAPTNAEIDAGANNLRKAWSVADVWRGALAALGRKAMPTFTAAGGETQVIYSVPAGSRSVAFEGSFAGSDPANTTLRARLSFDGGSTYLSASDSYQWQVMIASGTSVTTSENVGNSLPFAPPSDGGNALMSQFAVDLDFLPGRHGRFAGRQTGATGANNRVNDVRGFIRANGVPTHILIFQAGGTFVAGSQIRAEAK